MKRSWLLLLVHAASVLPAAEIPPPELSLRINGRNGAGAPLILWRGEPMLAEVGLRRTGSPVVDPLVLDPPDGGWFTRVTVGVNGSAALESWPLTIVGKPSTGALVLQPKTITTVVLRLDPAAAGRVPVGMHQLVARLNLADGRGWRGVVESDPVAVEVREAPATLTGADLGQRQLRRVRDALLIGDLPRAKAATAEIVSAEFERPEAFVATALVFAAEGKRRLALLSIDRAIALASGVAEVEGATATEAVVRKPIPFEYYDLRRHFEQMPSNEVQREPPLERAVEATVAVAPAPPSQPASTSPARPSIPLTHPTEAARHETQSTTGTTVPVQARPPEQAGVTPVILPDRDADQKPTTKISSRVPAGPPSPSPEIPRVTTAPQMPLPSVSTVPRPVNAHSADQGARDPKEFPRPEHSVRKSFSSIWQKTHSQDSATYSSTDSLDGLTEFYTRTLTAAGWEIVTKTENNQAVGNKRQAVLTWKKGSRTATITIVTINTTGADISVNLTVRLAPL